MRFLESNGKALGVGAAKNPVSIGGVFFGAGSAYRPDARQSAEAAIKSLLDIAIQSLRFKLYYKFIPFA